MQGCFSLRVCKNWLFWYLVANAAIFLRLSILRRHIDWVDVLLFLGAPSAIALFSAAVYFGGRFLSGVLGANRRTREKILSVGVIVLMTVYRLLNILLLFFAILIIMFPMSGLLYDWFCYCFY